jgi:excisionase family DNA binding protein
MTKKSNDEILSEIIFSNDVCEILKISKNTLLKWTQKNIIPHKKLRGRCVFFKSEIIAWIKNNQAA